MGDLQPFHKPLFDRFIALSRQSSSNRYQQLMAVGGYRFALGMAGGLIKKMQSSSDLMVTITVADKKNKSWNTAKSVEPNFNILADWDRSIELIAKKPAVQMDPRPSSQAGDLPEELTALRHYDPDVAALLPAVIFHRLFQSFGKFLEHGFLIDATCDYWNGFYSPRATPLCFAFVDHSQFCFQPQTTLFESICISHRNCPVLRRHIHHTSSKLDDLIQIEEVASALQTVDTARLIRFIPQSFDDIILMPGAAAQIVQYLLPRFSITSDTTEKPDKSVKWLSESLDFLCAPNDACFDHPGIVDVHGTLTADIELIHKGLPNTLPTNEIISKKLKCPNNGHATSNDTAEPFCPILKSADDIHLPSVTTPSQLTSGSDKCVLCIEHLSICVSKDDIPLVRIPDGGVLYQNGKCIAHVAPPETSFLLQPLIDSALPASTPVRIGTVASCCLQLDREAFKSSL